MMLRHVSLTVTLALAVTAFAVDARADDTDRRQRVQAARISQGVRSGELTKAETARVLMAEQRVRRMERRVEADGVVTKREDARLDRAQDHASKVIYRKKHNRRDR